MWCAYMCVIRNTEEVASNMPPRPLWVRGVRLMSCACFLHNNAQTLSQPPHIPTYHLAYESGRVAQSGAKGIFRRWRRLGRAA